MTGWRRALLALLLLVLAPAAAVAQTAPSFPALSGRVVDAASLLPADARASLDAKLKAQEDRTGDQVVVATVPSLGGLEVEDYANRLFRVWRLGEAKRNNGVLFLVAPTERKVRVEVGYGVEGGLTDAVAGTIIRTAVTPRFRTGDLPGGIAAGTDAILQVLAGDAEQWGRQAEPKAAAGAMTTTDLLMLVFWGIVLLLILRSVFRGAGASRAHRTRRGGWIMPVPGGFGGGGWGGGFGGGSSWGGGFGGGGGGFSGGGGSSGGGGASGSW